MHTSFVAELPNLTWYHTWGGGLILGVIHAHHRGSGSQCPLFWGFPSVYAFTLCHRTTKFDVITRGEGRVSWGLHASQPKAAITLSRCGLQWATEHHGAAHRNSPSLSVNIRQALRVLPPLSVTRRDTPSSSNLPWQKIKRA